MSVFRARRRGSLLGGFTFGGRIPPVLGFLLAAILAATVVAWILRDASWAVLEPGLLRRGEVWRLVSWAFVQEHPLTLLFGGLALYSFGLQLAHDWSERRFLWTFLGIAAGASVLTTLVALVAPVAPHLGMWPVVNALVLMWALRYPEQQLNFWGVIPLTGRTVAARRGAPSRALRVLDCTPRIASCFRIRLAWIVYHSRQARRQSLCVPRGGARAALTGNLRYSCDGLAHGFPDSIVPSTAR